MDDKDFLKELLDEMVSEEEAKLDEISKAIASDNHVVCLLYF